MKKLITIQHCQSVHHLNGMVGGATEWELTETGKEQAANIGIKLKEKLRSDPGYVMFSSDMIRARQTAEAVAAQLGIEPIYCAELRELDLGSATGKSREWLHENQIKRPDGLPWLYHRLLPDAESMEDVYHRVLKRVEAIDRAGHERVIVVGHGGSLSAFAAGWLKLPTAVLETMSLAGSAGGVSFFSEQDDMTRTLNVWNDTSYLTKN